MTQAELADVIEVGEVVDVVDVVEVDEVRQRNRTGLKHFGVASARCLLAGALLLFAVAPALATPANYSSSGFGFDPTNLGGLPTGMLAPSTPFLLAGAPGTGGGTLGVELLGSTDICIFVSGDNACHADPGDVEGAFSAIVTLTVRVIDEMTLSGPFTLLLNSLTSDPAYNLADVSIDLNPTVPLGLDTTALPPLFDGTFSPFVHIQDVFIDGMNVFTDHYIGWTVEDGDTVTFRYDVASAPIGGMAPQLTANATPLVVPEPGTALLLGAGLAGLSWRSGRRR